MKKYISSTSFKFEKAKYPVQQSDRGLVFSPPISKKPGNKWKLDSLRRQCGEYVNDAIGIPGYFSDKFYEKKKRIIKMIPSPGSVALLKTAMPWGHLLLMEEHIAGDRWIISESNYDDLGSYRRIETTIASLISRGLVGFTGGPNMVEVEEPSPWALVAIEKAKKMGILDWDTPREFSATKNTAWFLRKRGLITSVWNGKEYIPIEKAPEDAYLTKEQFAHVMDRLGQLG